MYDIGGDREILIVFMILYITYMRMMCVKDRRVTVTEEKGCVLRISVLIAQDEQKWCK